MHKRDKVTKIENHGSKVINSRSFDTMFYLSETNVANEFSAVTIW